MKNKIKILELTNFSAGGCGVFARVKRESVLLKKEGFEVKIFSSNLEKGANKVVAKEDNYEGVEIKRFPSVRLGGESFMNWNFEKDALNYNPDVIIAHGYRHLHTLKALNTAEKIGTKVFLVTHAPFDRDKNRGFAARIIVNLFDKIIGKRIINRYDKIIAITKWECPYLYSLRADASRIEYIPNGISPEFFKKKMGAEKDKIIYMGRISPIKDITTLIKSIPLLKDKTIILELYGPAENEYLKEIKNLIKKLNLIKRVILIDRYYDSKTQIKELDSSKIFVLPSISEGMPQVLIEALSREKIVIASNNKGNADIIKNGRNGFLFEVGNSKDLAKKINLAMSLNKMEVIKMKKNAEITARGFLWGNIIKSLVSLIHKA